MTISTIATAYLLILLSSSWQIIAMAQTSTILQISSLAIQVLAIIFLVITAGLFGDALRRYNLQIDRQLCFLYITKNNYNPSNSNCNFSIVGEVLAALSLVILVILNIVKIAYGLIGWVFKLINKREWKVFFRNKIF